MSEFDVRKDTQTEITSILFSEEMVEHTTVTHKLVKRDRTGVTLQDIDYDTCEGTGYVVVINKEHAENLMKALAKASELGWLK